MSKLIPNALFALALVAGCGDVTTLNGVKEHAPAVTQLPATPAPGLGIDLRMRAVSAEAYKQLLVLPQSVQVTADGIPVAVDLTGALIDLADMQNAQKVASFNLPEGTQTVDFTVALAPSGAFDTAAGSGWVDSRQTVLHFTSSAANLAEKGKAVLIFDAAKSFVAREEGTRTLVPKFAIRY
jgi:hypothetical protein